MEFKVEKVSERDIDLLVINNFLNNKLLNVFLNRIDIKDYELVSVEHSFMDADLGESDITAIIDSNGKRIGLLIEDKIDASAMDLQPERYIERGKKGIQQNYYSDFKTFIIAPEQYLKTNPYVEKYQYQISYEELINELSDDLYATVLLKKAIEEKESGYIIIENENVTKFWEKYYEFIRLYYPRIKIHEINGPRGSRAAWPEMNTDYKQVVIMHKSDRGYMDLTFGKMANHIEIFDKYVREIAPDLNIVKTGKSLSIRLNVPILDFKSDFDNYIQEMHECMKSAVKLYDILSKINVLMMYNEVEKSKKE